MFLHTRDKMYANRCDKLQNPTSAHVVSLDVAALKAVKHQRLVGDAKKKVTFCCFEQWITKNKRADYHPLKG